MHGTLEPAGDQWRLVFKRHLPHSPDKVWRALIEPAHRDTWFPQQIVGDWHVGAPLRFVSQFGDFEGRVLTYEPESIIEFLWGPDVIRLEIAPEGSGTVLTLSDTFAEHGKAARDAAGWHVCLDALEAHLRGTRSDTQWQQVHPQYVQAFGREAATIGPPQRT